MIAQAIEERLERKSFNKHGEVAAIPGGIGFPHDRSKRYDRNMAAIMARRHRIVPRADRNHRANPGSADVRSIAKAPVVSRGRAIELFGRKSPGPDRGGGKAMTMAMTLQDMLPQRFDGVRRAPSDEVLVRPSGYGRFMINGVPSGFEAMPEQDRPSFVWRLILDNLTAYEQSKVEFVFTNSPSEMVDAGEANER